MNYLIVHPLSYQWKQRAEYNHDLSMDRFVFFEGEYVKGDQVDKPIIFNMKLKMSQALAFDNIINNSSCLLVNEKASKILQKLAPEEVQFFDTEIRCKDGVLTNYKLVNITQNVEGVDLEKSICEKMVNIDAIRDFKRLVLTKECMSGYKIARLKESLGHILATKEIKQAFEAARVTGLRFVTSEDFYAETYPYYAENSVWPRAME